MKKALLILSLVGSIQLMAVDRPQAMRDSLFASQFNDDYYAGSSDDFNQVMSTIEHQWMEGADRSFVRKFYECYLLYYHLDKGCIAAYQQIGHQLLDMYSPADSLQRAYVRLCLCRYDSTLTPEQQLDQAIAIFRQTQWHPAMTFGNRNDFADLYPHWNLDCEYWNCNDPAINLRLDTLFYLQTIASARCYRLSDWIPLDSIRQADGYQSESYRNALLGFMDKHKHVDGCGMVADCFRQMLTWPRITEADIRWVEANAKISQPVTPRSRIADDWLDLEYLQDWPFWCSHGEGSALIDQLYTQLIEKAQL